MFKRIILVAATLAAGSAFAGETDNQPGAMCSAVGTGSLSVRDDGEVENKTAATVTAICPVERPISGLTTVLSGKVFVVDRHASANVCCRAVSKNPGGTKTAGAWACSTGSSSSYQTLDLASISDSYTFSSFYLECQVPAISSGNASRIQTYRAIQQ